MPSRTSHGTALALLSAFVRAIAHKVRTPLSVITNDLSYLQTLVPPNECDRSLERSREIANLLRRLCEVGDAEVVLKPLLLGAVLPPNLAGLSELTVLGDESKLRLAFEFMNEVLFALGRGAMDVAGSVTQASSIIELRHAMDVARPEIDGQSFETFTSLVNLALERDSPFPPLLDALLLAHGCGMQLRISGVQLVLRLSFPRVAVE